MSRSRSINITPDEDEEDGKRELTNHQRSIAVDFLAEDERDGLMGSGEPMLTDTTQVGIPLNDDDAEMDGLLVGATAVPVTKRKRRRIRTSTCRNICFRGVMSIVMVAIFIAAIMFGATVVRKQKSLSSNNLRGDGTMGAPSADIFKGDAAMSNAHGLDIHAGETNSNDIESHNDNHCRDSQTYQHDNKVGLNCEWVAQENTARRCANERILRDCPATCDPICGGAASVPVPVPSNKDHIQKTEFPTEFPTTFPTLFPTEFAFLRRLQKGGDCDVATGATRKH